MRRKLFSGVQQFQKLRKVLFTKENLFAVVDYQAGNAHYLVFLSQIGEMVQVIYLCRHLRMSRGQTLGSGHQLRAHGAG